MAIDILFVAWSMGIFCFGVGVGIALAALLFKINEWREKKKLEKNK